MTPEQEALFQALGQGLQGGGGPFGDLFGGFNQEAFQQNVAGPMMRQFFDEVLPQLQEGFIGSNTTLGSGFQRASTKAAAGLQDQLSQLMYQAMQDQNKNRMSGLQQYLGTQTHENVFRPGTSGFLNEAGKGLAQGIGSALGGGLGGGFGSIGDIFTSLFQKSKGGSLGGSNSLGFKATQNLLPRYAKR